MRPPTPGGSHISPPENSHRSVSHPSLRLVEARAPKKKKTTALQSLLLSVLMFVTVATWPRHWPISCESGAPSKNVSLRRFCKARVILRLTDSICSIAVNLKINKYERCFSELRAAHQLCRREKTRRLYLILVTRALAVSRLTHRTTNTHTESG